MFEPINESVATNRLFESLSQERKQLQTEGLLPLWYTTQAWQMFKDKYAYTGEQAVLGRHSKIAETLAKHLPVEFRDEYCSKFLNLMWGGLLSPSTPALTNVGTKRGQPVACSGQVIGDSIKDFYGSMQETALLSKHGYGTSGYFGGIRSRGTKFGEDGIASGAKEVIDDFFTTASKVSQGGKRRGVIAAYIEIDHPDFYECLHSLKSTPNGKNYGWNISDAFVQRLINGDEDAHERWKDALHVKLLTGKGYLFFPDKANRHRPQMYKDLGLDIIASNLCTEIMLFSDTKHTFSCILASMNLVHWKRIKESSAVFDSMVFLDCLVSESLHTSKGVKGLKRVRRSTEKGRAVGLGVMGFHTYLQSQGIPYESLEAQYLHNEIFKHLHDESLRASKWLAELLGEPEWCKGTGLRNTHRTAKAPTKSTALLMGGVSESDFPDPGMVFTSGSSVGELDRITPVIYETMKAKGVYNPDTIKDIVQHLGSVQHVTWLSDEEKKVFKNAFEIDQRIILRRTSLAQKWVCQGQSLNFYISDENAEIILSDLMSAVALDGEILSSYYVYTRSGVVISDVCVGCSG